jgi:hypothetical protein
MNSSCQVRSHIVALYLDEFGNHYIPNFPDYISLVKIRTRVNLSLSHSNAARRLMTPDEIRRMPQNVYSTVNMGLRHLLG